MTDNGKEASPIQNTQKHSLKATILSSSEGHIFLTGLTLAMLYIIWLAVTGFWDPERAQNFIVMTAIHVFLGRAAGMSFGYTLGFGNQVIILLNIAIETIQVLLFYSLFVLSWQQLLVIKRLQQVMQRIRNAAETNRHVIRHYGLPGLFVFVWIPFWMTGSVVGCVIGFLLDFHPWLTVSVVLGGSYIAIISWALLLRHLHVQAAQFGAYAPLGILAVIIGIGLINHVRHRHHQKNHTPPDP